MDSKLYAKLDVKDKNHISYVCIKLKELLTTDVERNIEINPNLKYVKHVILHRQAFANVEHKTKYHGMFSLEHDIDKIGISLILGKDEAKRLHKLLAPHHNVSWKKNDIRLVEKAIDWESCHYSKLNKQATAYEYLMKCKSDKVEVMEPVLKELGLWKKEHKKKLTEKHYKQMEDSVDMETIISSIKKSLKYLSEVK